MRYLVLLALLTLGGCYHDPHRVDVTCGGPPFSEKAMTETINSAVFIISVQGGFSVDYMKDGRIYNKKYPLSCRYYEYDETYSR
jgi:hypothetical protein